MLQVFSQTICRIFLIQWFYLEVLQICVFGKLNVKTLFQVGDSNYINAYKMIVFSTFSKLLNILIVLWSSKVHFHILEDDVSFVLRGILVSLFRLVPAEGVRNIWKRFEVRLWKLSLRIWSIRYKDLPLLSWCYI